MLRNRRIAIAFLSISILVINLLIPTQAFTQNNFTPVYKPTLHIQRTSGEIKIDGHLNDTGWRNVAVVDHFVESSPGDQIKPPVETKAMMTYDDEYLYVAMVAQADPEQVRASLCERDRTQGDDNLGVFIDTYGDAAWAYMFFVNAHGIQYDATTTTSHGTDTKYDLIWEAAGHKTDSGFQVELAIPFASLRFPDQEIQEWKVEFHRFHEREVTYELTWAAYDRDEPCWPCQWGTVTGIENVKPGRGVEIIPAVVGFQSGELLTRGDSLNFSNDDFNGDLSLSTKYSISSSATAEIAINPDFSQVEADADQIDVNSTTALWFPEKRPFFQEGADLFRSRYSIVYTRSINEPDVAAKFTYRKGRTAMAYLGAHDRFSPIIIPFYEFSSPTIQAEESFSNIFRARQTFSTNSWIGFLGTDRRLNGGGSGSTLGLDGLLRLTKSLQLSWQVTTSHTTEPDDTTLTNSYSYYDFREERDIFYDEFLFDGDHTAAYDGESFWGHAVLIDFDYDISDLSVTSAYLEKSPTFRTDNGIETSNNRRYADFWASRTVRFDDGPIKTIEPGFGAYGLWHTDGKMKQKDLEFNLSFNFRWAQTSNHNQYSMGTENYAGMLFEGIWGAHHCFHITPNQYVSLSGSANYGHKIARGDREMGSERQFTGSVNLKPTESVRLNNSLNYLNSISVNTGEELFKGYILRSKLTLHFNRQIWLRFVAQYNDFRETWDFDPLLTYQINPFTLFYVGTTYDYRAYHDLNSQGTNYVDDPNIDLSYSHTKLKARQSFMKLQYLFQI